MYVFTKGEYQVLLEILKGKRSSAIAIALEKNKRTIDGIRRNIKKKMPHKTIYGLITKSLTIGLVNDQISPFSKIREPLGHDQTLTWSQSLFLHCLLNGFTIKEIAKQMDISERKAIGYKDHIFEIWGVKSATDLVIKSLENGYIELDIPNQTQGLEIDKATAVMQMLRASPNNSAKFVFFDQYSIHLTYPKEVKHNLNALQLEILRLQLMGKSDKMISENLKISIKTIANNNSLIKQELKVNTTKELVLEAVNIGVVRTIPILPRYNCDRMEFSIIQQIADSTPLKSIAESLKCSVSDVAMHVKRIKAGFKVASVEGVVFKAMCEGILDFKV